jgi:bacterioferritin
MQADRKIIDALNKVLENELLSVQQYFIHARVFEHLGFTKLFDRVYRESIDEMKHADILIKRILFLEGRPRMTADFVISAADKPEEMLKNDLELEYKAIADLKKALAVAVESGDSGSEQLLEGIYASEEAHVEWLERQLSLIRSVGVEGYLRQQM